MGLLRVRTFDGLSLSRTGAGDVPVGGAATQRRPLALLAVLASAGTRGVTRDRLVLRLWPESEPDRARNVLKQTLYKLRRDLNESELVTGTVELALNPAVITSDVGEFEAAIDNGDLARAAALYTGPFLDGFYLNDAPEFERWVAAERRRLEHRAVTAVRALADEAAQRNDLASAVSWWRRLAAIDPADALVTTRLMAALAASGDRAGALQAAREHEQFLRAEFDAPIDPAVSALADEIRNGTLPAEAREAVVHLVAVPNDVRHQDAATDVVPTAPAATAPDSTSPAVRATTARTGRFTVVRAAELAVIVFAAIAAISIAARQSRKPPDTTLSDRRVVVTEFDNETGDPSLAAIGRVATDWVVQGLAKTQLVDVIGPGVRIANLSALGVRGPARGAGLIVRGAYSRTADTLVMHAQLVEAASGRVVRAVGPVAGPMGEPLVAIERLRQGLAGALATRVDRRLARWSDAASQPTSFEAYRALDEGLNEFFSRHDSSYARAGRQLVHAAALDSAFNLPLLWALYAFRNAHDSLRVDSVIRVLGSRRERMPPFDLALLDAHVAAARSDRIAEYDALRRLVAIAPRSEWLYKAAYAAMLVNHMAEADSLLDALDPDAGWMYEWEPYWNLRTDVAYVVGHHDVELAAASRRNERYPVDGYHRRQLGRALAALGRGSELLALVDDAIGRKPADLNAEALLRIISAARVHGHLALARAVADRSLASTTTGATVSPDSAVQLSRYKVLVLEATERWEDAAAAAHQLIRLDSVAHRRDALPYMVLLQVALEHGTVADTIGLEGRALAEVAARSPSDAASANWRSESPLAVRAELAALHRDPERTAVVLSEAKRQGIAEYYWYSERPAFDAVRSSRSVSGLLHRPGVERQWLALGAR